MGAAHLNANQMNFRGMSAISMDEYATCVTMQLGATRGLFTCGPHAPLPGNNLIATFPDKTSPTYAELVDAKLPAVATTMQPVDIGDDVPTPLGTKLLALAPR